jgi:hypothetical protein
MGCGKSTQRTLPEQQQVTRPVKKQQPSPRPSQGTPRSIQGQQQPEVAAQNQRGSPRTVPRQQQPEVTAQDQRGSPRTVPRQQQPEVTAQDQRGSPRTVPRQQQPEVTAQDQRGSPRTVPRQQQPALSAQNQQGSPQSIPGQQLLPRPAQDQQGQAISSDPQPQQKPRGHHQSQDEIDPLAQRAQALDLAGEALTAHAIGDLPPPHPSSSPASSWATASSNPSESRQEPTSAPQEQERESPRPSRPSPPPDSSASSSPTSSWTTVSTNSSPARPKPPNTARPSPVPKIHGAALRSSEALETPRGPRGNRHSPACNCIDCKPSLYDREGYLKSGWTTDCRAKGCFCQICRERARCSQRNNGHLLPKEAQCKAKVCKCKYGCEEVDCRKCLDVAESERCKTITRA